MSAHFRWPWSISIHLCPRSVAAGVRPFPLAMQYAAFLFICLQGLSLVVFSLFGGHVAFLFICLPGLSVLVSFSAGHAAFQFICLPVSALFRWPCIVCWPSRSVDATFLSICLPGLSVVVSALFRWRSNFSIHSPNSSLLGVLNSFLTRVRPFCHCCCPPFSAGDAAIHLSPSFRACTAGVRPFPLATQHFFSCLSPM